LDDLCRPEIEGEILILLGVFCLVFRRIRLSAVLAISGVTWILLCATPAFAALLRRGVDYPTPTTQYPEADAIVVLGGGDPAYFDRSDEQARSTRAGVALDLYRQSLAPVIVASGGDGEAEEMVQGFIEQGVPPAALRSDPDSHATYQNAANSARILDREQRHRILLVTSSVPMRRAAACFERLGFEVIPVPTANAGDNISTQPTWKPQWAMLYESRRYIHEYVGIVFYKLRGHI
jgi:uncharacterized SAM-binding protein YcdF (DUF218 family)